MPLCLCVRRNIVGHGFHSLHWAIVANSVSSIWSVTQEVKSYMSLPSLGNDCQSCGLKYLDIAVMHTFL